MSRRKVLVWSLIGVALAAGVAVAGFEMFRWSMGAMRIRGAVIRRDSDTRRELPIAGVEVAASDGATRVTTTTNAAGYFNLPFPSRVWPGQVVTLSFRHSGYEPLDLTLQGGARLVARKIHVAALQPEPAATPVPIRAATVVSNIRVRYTTNSQNQINIGSAVKTFQVVNRGNVPCNRKLPCSPDERWKASTATETLDAGPGNEFGNVRVSCIAGPCPFTRIDTSGFANGGRVITATATCWSDTTTFLLEAEVFHSTNVSNVRELYPVIFGRSLNFTVPPVQEGVSIEADINKEPMVFPLGPELYLSWATCTARTDNESERNAVYRCELKPGYRF